MIDLRQVPPELFAQILQGNLQGIGPARKLHGHFAEAVRLRLRAEAVWVLGEDGEMWTVAGDRALCDRARTAEFLAGGQRPAGVSDLGPRPAAGSADPGGGRRTVLARVTVHGRTLAVVGAARRGRELGQAARRTLDRLCGVLAQELARREEQRLARVLDRIRGKVVSELRPRDLAYQVLDGLHQLVDYDHSSAFLTWEPAAGALRIEAEKIVWTKGKSAFVGHEIALRRELVDELISAPGIRRLRGDAGGDPFWEMLDYHRGRGIPQPSSLLCAPLSFAGEFLGLLKIAAWKRHPFDRWDERVVERFLPAAAVAIRNARVHLSVAERAVQSEVKATLVTLASAVAHDVNNAVGTILPLVQQVRADLSRGELDGVVLARDLEVVEEKAHLCQRIFSNMLRVARSGRGGDGPVDLNQLVRETLPFFEGRALRHGIAPALSLAAGLAPVRASRHDLEHILLNLANNSLDALEGLEGIATLDDTHPLVGPLGPAGTHRRLEIATAERDGRALLAVADDGPGIPSELLEKVQEPFFSTKPNGTGLGLAICRTLAWQNGGRLEIASASGSGTRVTVELPFAAAGDGLPAPAAGEAPA